MSQILNAATVNTRAPHSSPSREAGDPQLSTGARVRGADDRFLSSAQSANEFFPTGH